MLVEALLVAKAVSDFNQHELPKEAVAWPAQNDWRGASLRSTGKRSREWCESQANRAHPLASETIPYRNTSFRGPPLMS